MIINIHSQLDKPKEPIRNRSTLRLKLYPVLSDQIIFAYLTNKQLLRKFAKIVTWRCKFRVYEHLISKDLSRMSSNVLLLLFVLLSGLMLFPGKKNATIVDTNQLSQLLWLFLFFHFISNTFCIILAVPSKQGFCNASIVKSRSNFSIHFLKSFVTVPNVPITNAITFTFLTFF